MSDSLPELRSDVSSRTITDGGRDDLARETVGSESGATEGGGQDSPPARLPEADGRGRDRSREDVNSPANTQFDQRLFNSSGSVVTPQSTSAELPARGHAGFSVTRDGTVRETATGRVLKPRPFGKYPVIDIGAKTQSMHRLVCETFHGPPPCSDCEVHHKDQDKTNFHADNLEWLTPKEHKAIHRDLDGQAAAPVSLPHKPYPGFPLTPDRNGEWCRSFKGKGMRRCFGSWKTDPTGDQAFRAYRKLIDPLFGGLAQVSSAPIRGGMTLEQLSRKYLQAREADVTSGKLLRATFDNYVTEINAFVAATGFAVESVNLTAEHFATYVDHLRSVRKLGPSATKRTVAVVKAMFHFATKREWIPPVVFGTSFRVRVEPRAALRPTFEPAEIDTLLKIGNKRLRTMILLALNCGMGPSDIVRLKWSDIDFTTGRLVQRMGRSNISREASSGSGHAMHC